MKPVLISLAFTIFATLLFSYFLNNLQVFNTTNVQEIRNNNDLVTANQFYDYFYELRDSGRIFEVVNLNSFIAITISSFLLITSSFSTLHMFIDKMFFKKFYQIPDIFSAIRRGFFLALLLCSILVLHILGIWDTTTVIMVVIFVVCFELLLSRYLHKPELPINNENEADKIN